MGEIEAILRAKRGIYSWLSGQILRNGEFAYETDNYGLKIGDDTLRHYNELPYLIPPRNGKEGKYLKVENGYAVWADGIDTTAIWAAIDSKYEIPAGGIPKADLDSSVQASLEKADTSHQDISGKADKVSEATNGDIAGLDSNGNLTDSGISTTDASDAVSKKHSHTNKTILDYIPSSLGTAGQAIVVNSDATGLKFATVGGGGGGLTDYDFTHVGNTTVTTSTTITFAANIRGSQMVSTAADLAVTFAVNNESDNYLWIKNTGSSDIDITISAVTAGGSPVSNVYIPDDGISVSAGKVCEIGIIVNADGAFITSRSDLAL